MLFTKEADLLKEKVTNKDKEMSNYKQSVTREISNLKEELINKKTVLAEKKEDKAMAHVGFMRLNSMKKEKGWLEEVEKNFFSARSIMKDLPEAYFYLAMAYKDGYRFHHFIVSDKK